MSKYRYVCLMDADNELIADNLPLFLQSIIETGAALVHGNLLEKQGRAGNATALRQGGELASHGAQFYRRFRLGRRERAAKARRFRVRSSALRP